MTENLAQKIREEREPEGAVFRLSSEARRLRRALAVANKWRDAAFEDGGSGDLLRVAETTHDEIEEELSRTALRMDVLRRRREIDEAGHVFSSDEDLEGLSRAAVVSDSLLAVY